MCGIACVVNNVGENVSILNKMLDKQAHRGPDSKKTLFFKNIGLGHNRLSIIDLGEKSDQPMVSFCNNYSIIFNGEIYNYVELKSLIKNYRFKTKSDTEVLLALYIEHKHKMMNLIYGMFSFIIYDKKRNLLFGARDRFGVKPFFYAKHKESFFFASEIKSIFESGIEKRKNMNVWSNYLVNGTYGNQKETFWHNIFQVKAGHYFYFDFQKMKINEYPFYDFVGNIKEQKEESISNVKDKYLSLLKDSIYLRFRSDVPVGVCLSGGLDSSILLGLTNNFLEKNKRIHAFTFYSNDNRYDEIDWVEKVLNKSKNPLHKVLFDINHFDDLFNEVSYYQDEPFGGFPTMAYSNIFKEAHKNGFKVLLDGQGMDEAWAGYDYYQNDSSNKVQGVSGQYLKKDVLNEEFIGLSLEENYPEPFRNPLLNKQFRDLFFTKLPRALRFNDRISMMHSVELREPFLDHRLVEYAFSLPKHYKIKNNTGKFLLRHIAKTLFQEKIINSPKRTLQTPQREWLARELKEWSYEKIIQFSKFDFVKKNKVIEEWEKYQKGNKQNSFYLWHYINL